MSDLAKIEIPTLADILAGADLKPFSKCDWDAFCGCQSERPYIGYYQDLTVILDGDLITLYAEDGSFRHFQITPHSPERP